MNGLDDRRMFAKLACDLEQMAEACGMLIEEAAHALGAAKRVRDHAQLGSAERGAALRRIDEPPQIVNPVERPGAQPVFERGTHFTQPRVPDVNGRGVDVGYRVEHEPAPAGAPSVTRDDLEELLELQHATRVPVRIDAAGAGDVAILSRPGHARLVS